MTSYRIARRAFLRGCGAAPLLLPLLRNIEARAAGAAAPLRFLVITRPCGTQLNLWRPGLAATSDAYTLPTLSAPFASLQSKMVMVDGLNVVAASRAAGNSGGTSTAEGGTVALMTGQPTLGQIGQQDHCAGGRSIDQILLDGSPVLGGAASATKTRFPSLQLAADIRSDRDEIAPRVLSYLDPLPGVIDLNRARQPLFPEKQPLNVYNRVFGGSLPGGGTRGRSVIDFARRDLTRMRRIVPASETGKLDAYAAAIQQLEASLTASQCAKPAAPPVFAETGVGALGSTAPPGGSKLTGVDYYDANDANNHPHQTLGRLQLSLIRVAFLCDLTRVATFMWSAGTSGVYFPNPFNGATLPFASNALPHYAPSHAPDPGTVAWLAQIELFYAQQTAQLLQEIAATTDVDGNSLLDNTVIVYASEVGRALDNDQRNVPFLIFGGKNTGIHGGRFLKVAGGPLATADGGTGNRPTNDAWLALAPIFGVNLTALGAPAQFTGALPGIVG